VTGFLSAIDSFLQLLFIGDIRIFLPALVDLAITFFHHLITEY